MTKYDCGHESDAVILDNNILSFTAYLDWMKTVGFDGIMCFPCYCKKQKRGTQQKREVRFPKIKRVSSDLRIAMGKRGVYGEKALSHERRSRAVKMKVWISALRKGNVKEVITDLLKEMEADSK